MKICIVGDATSVHVVKWVKWFSKSHEVHLISDKKADIPNVTIHLVGMKHGTIALVLKGYRARKIIRTIKPDIIHAHYAMGYGTIGAMCHRSPFIISIWGSDITVDSTNRIKKIVLKYTLRKADYISAYDSVLFDQLGKMGFHDIMRKRIVGIDMKSFNPSRPAIPIPGSTTRPSLTLLCTRPLNAQGGVETLIRAMPKIKKVIPDATVFLVYPGGNDNKEEMEVLAESLGVKSDIVFLGLVAHDSMPDTMAASDVFVDTYMPEMQAVDKLDRFPGLGAAAMEAMASGVPVIIPRRKGIGADCPYVPYTPHDPDSLANAVIGLQDKGARETIVELALTYIRENASEEVIMADWEEFYESLSGKPMGMSRSK
jgi:glycosyltransferase involved in cell wall biosynthesis